MGARRIAPARTEWLLGDYRAAVSAAENETLLACHRAIDGCRRVRAHARRTADGLDLLSQVRMKETDFSRLLAYFLDPEADHGQGELFFRLLLPRLRRRAGRLPTAYARDGYTVRCEVSSQVEGDETRIDIDITSLRYWSGGFVIHIENKVDARPDRKQLKRESAALKQKALELRIPEGRAHGFLLSAARPAGPGETTFSWLGWATVRDALLQYSKQAAPRAGVAAELFARAIKRRLHLPTAQEETHEQDRAVRT